MAGFAFGLWLNIEDKRRRFPLLNLPESKISQLVEKYGDLAKVSQNPDDEDEGLTVGLLDGSQTPTLYDVRGGCLLLVAGCVWEGESWALEGALEGKEMPLLGGTARALTLRAQLPCLPTTRPHTPPRRSNVPLGCIGILCAYPAGEDGPCYH